MYVCMYMYSIYACMPEHSCSRLGALLASSFLKERDHKIHLVDVWPRSRDRPVQASLLHFLQHLHKQGPKTKSASRKIMMPDTSILFVICSLVCCIFYKAHHM